MPTQKEGVSSVVLNTLLQSIFLVQYSLFPGLFALYKVNGLVNNEYRMKNIEHGSWGNDA